MADISPITDYSGRLSLEFVDYVLAEDEIKHTIEECKERDLTYEAPVKIKVRLHNKEKEEITEHEIFMGNFPLMTETGTFVINGAERVIVSQLVRSPGIYYGIAHDKIGKRLFSCTVIPNRGAWLEYETDSNDVFYVRVDRTRKVPITVLVRALGVGTNEEILELFGDEPKILASFTKDTADNYQEGLKELYSKIRPGEPFSLDSAENLVTAMFFDPRRYDLAKVGRYKFNKKLALKNRIRNQILAEDVVDPFSGEILGQKGDKVTAEMADSIQNAAVPFVWIQTEERLVKVLSNMMVDITNFVDCEPRSLGITEQVYFPVLRQILEEYAENPEELADAITRNVHELIPKHITKEDILASINYNMHLEYGLGNSDDIDHLGNRRIRAVGELLQNQYRIGLSRMERVVRERMTTHDSDDVSPQALINIKPVQAAIKEFFGSSQLSQFMDQNNPLGELTHKRRLSALGPGGLSRDRAGFEVRDVHYSHYGRMCPIETPEGPNIGLINSLASYARINEYGFIEAPYRKIDKTDPKNPRVTNEVVYMTADEEDNYHVAQANEQLDENGYFVRNSVSGRYLDETQEYPKAMFDYMDVSPKMVFSVATALIPFVHLIGGDPPVRQARPEVIVESHHGAVLRHPDPPLLQLVDQPAGHQVAVADEGLRQLLRQLHDNLPGSVPILQQPLLPERYAVLQQAAPEAAVPVHDAAGGMDGAHVGHAPKAPLVQVLRHQVHAVEAVRHHRVLRYVLVVKIQEDHGHLRAAFQESDVFPVNLPHDDQPLRRAFLHEAGKPPCLFRIMLQDLRHHGTAPLRRRHGDLHIDLPVERDVVRQVSLRDEDADAPQAGGFAGRPLLVLEVSHLPGLVQDPFPDLIADPLAPCQRIVHRHRAYAHLIGYVLHPHLCHRASPFLLSVILYFT